MTVTVPEGPHRDRHEFSVIVIANRHNVRGGETQVIEPEHGDAGHRDIWVIEINRWDQRAYGPKHERQASHARFVEEIST